MEKVSVIIPIYQVEQTIACCLQSVIDQTYKNIEIICVDDCGNDRSVQIVERIMKQYPDKIRLIHGEKNEGLGGARDKGLYAAEGDFVAFLDSDDYLEKDFIEKYMQAMDKHFDIVIGNFIRVTPECRHALSVDVSDETFPWENVSACTKLYRRSFLERNKIDFAGIRRYEDIIFTYKILLHKPKIRLINYAGYNYCLNEESITQSKRKDRSVFVEEYMENIHEFLNGLGREIKRNTMFGYCMISNLNAVLLFNGRGCGIKKMKGIYKNYKYLLGRIYTECYSGSKVRSCALKGESWKKKYSTWLILHLQKFKSDEILFLLISLL